MWWGKVFLPEEEESLTQPGQRPQELLLHPVTRGGQDTEQEEEKEEEILAGPWQSPIGSDIKSTIRQLEEIRADRSRRMEEKMKKKKF